nr:unnamed protein product [Callosobruchus chinensis]
MANRSTTNNPIRIKRQPVNLAQATVDRSRARNNILQKSTPNKVRLRRYMSGPQNVRVEVVNNTCMLPQFKYKRFKQILNHDLQLEIRQLQQRAAPTKKYWIQKVTPVSTNIKMQDRFAQLR